jgi:hypothetical protein
VFSKDASRPERLKCFLSFNTTFSRRASSFLLAPTLDTFGGFGYGQAAAKRASPNKSSRGVKALTHYVVSPERIFNASGRFL